MLGMCLFLNMASLNVKKKFLLYQLTSLNFAYNLLIEQSIKLKLPKGYIQLWIFHF